MRNFYKLNKYEREKNLVLCYDRVSGMLNGTLVETLLYVDQLLVVLTLLHARVDMVEYVLGVVVCTHQLIILIRVGCTIIINIYLHFE